jgi:hypothetical protein
LGWPIANISLEKTNVFYIGVPNPIRILVNGYDVNEIEVSLDNGKITGAKGVYTVIPNEKTATDTIHLFLKLPNGKKREIYKSTYRVNRIKDPVVTFAGKSDGSLSIANIKAQDRIFVDIPNFIFDAKFNITGFTLQVMSRADKQTFNTEGNQLSPQMKSAISNLKIGDKLFFTNLRAVGPDRTLRGLDYISFTAK